MAETSRTNILVSINQYFNLWTDGKVLKDIQLLERFIERMLSFIIFLGYR